MKVGPFGVGAFSSAQSRDCDIPTFLHNSGWVSFAYSRAHFTLSPRVFMPGRVAARAIVIAIDGISLLRYGLSMEQALEGIPALQAAAKTVGGQSALARALGTSQGYISDIIRLGKEIPAEWCPKIEQETTAKGKPVTRQQLRPDLWPADEVAQ